MDTPTVHLDPEGTERRLRVELVLNSDRGQHSTSAELFRPRDKKHSRCICRREALDRWPDRGLYLMDDAKKQFSS